MAPTRVIRFMKLAMLATWLVAAAGLLLPGDSGPGQAARTLIGLLLVVHLLEFGFFWGILRRTGRPLPVELAETLVFGVVRYVEARLEVEAREDAGEGDPGA